MSFVVEDHPCVVTIHVKNHDSHESERRIFPISIRYKANKGVGGDWFLVVFDFDFQAETEIPFKNIVKWDAANA